MSSRSKALMSFSTGTTMAMLELGIYALRLNQICMMRFAMGVSRVRL